MATVVTCYYKIPSKHPHQQYEAWIENFMSLPMKTVIFVNDETEKILRKKYPDRFYVNVPVETFYVNKYNWEKDESLDFQLHYGRNITLYKIWNEKPFFLLHAAQLNPFNSDVFMWVDIGCFRHKEFLTRFQNFPNINKIDKSKISFLQHNPFTPAQLENPYSVDDRFLHSTTLGGTMFICPKELLVWFVGNHANILEEYDKSGNFKGDDQHKYAFSIVRNPDKFNIIFPPKNYDYDSWFYFHDYFA